MTLDYKIDYTPTFAKQFRILPTHVQQKAQKKERLLRTQPFCAELRTHKLSGRLAGYWSCSITYHYRIVFRKLSDRHLLLVAVGTHAVYR